MSATAAFFDVDGTIVRGNIVRWYAHFRTRGLGPLARLRWTLGYLPRVARWIALDRIDRRRMNLEFYRDYRGLGADELARQAEADYSRLLAPRVFGGARERIARHRAEGQPVVLVTGSLDFVMRPLARALGADDLVAVEMGRDGDRLTGELVGEPLAGEEKARAVRGWAARHAIDLASSWAYGDSASDLPVLEIVGHPVAVNPDRRLRRRAQVRGWEVASWSPGPGA